MGTPPEAEYQEYFGIINISLSTDIPISLYGWQNIRKWLKAYCLA